MMPDEHALATVIEVLRRLGIPFMVTGSIATSFHGRPRATHDADLVIDPSPPQLDALINELEASTFYVSPDGARAALRQRSQFNAIDTAHASKIDLIIKRERPFSEEEFARRIPVDLSFATAVPIVTPEDAVVSKLEWARRSGDSERQVADAAGVLALNPNLDRSYIDRWTRALGVHDLWVIIATGHG